MRRLGLDASDIGYFLYCDGDRFTEETFLKTSSAVMQFKITLLPYKCDLSWIEPALYRIKEVMLKNNCPQHSETCEHGAFIEACTSQQSVHPF